jgi:hypothetical protein
VIREIWLIDDKGLVLAADYEIERFHRTWVFYHLTDNNLVHLVGFGHMGPSVKSILPHFGEIFGFAMDVDTSNGCLLIMEGENGLVWWLFYIRLSCGEYLLLFTILSSIVDMLREGRTWDLGGNLNDSSSSGFVFQVYDL